MKKLFFCVMSLVIGALLFVSCDKDEKDDLTEKSKEKQIERVDTSTVFTLSQQQNAFNQALVKLGQEMDFSDLSQAVGIVLKQFKNNIEWEDALKAACKQDIALGRKVNAIKHFLRFSGDISINFDDINFEADIAFKDSVIKDSSEYFYYKDTYYPDDSQIDEKVSAFLDSLIIEKTKKVPFLLNDIDHNADKLKLNLHTTDGNIISLCLKGHNDSESRISVTDTIGKKARNVTLPDSLDILLSLNDDTLLCVNAGYATNFKVDVKGTKNEKNKFKLSDLYFTGNELSLGAGASLGMYSIKTKVNYDDENGLNVGFAAGISSTEAVSGNIHLRGKMDNRFNWAELSSLLVWATNEEDFKGVDCYVNIFSDEIKMHVGIENPLLNGNVLQLFAYLAATEPNTLDEATIIRYVDEFNSVLKGEIYFKGYDQPQAIVRLAYEPQTKGALFDLNSTINSVVANFNRLGLKIGIETYNDDGVKVIVPFKDYFVEKDYKAFLNQLKQKFEIAFGQVINMLRGDGKGIFSLF